MNNLKLIYFFLILILSIQVKSAEVNTNKKEKEDNYVKPIVINSSETNDSSLGAEYALNGKLFEKKFDLDDTDTDELNRNPVYGSYELTYSFDGTITENSDNNPKNLLESRVAFKFVRLSEYQLKAGAFIEYETDQKFDNKQLVYGLTGTVYKYGLFSQNNTFAFHANYGQVDPSKNTSREAILGSNLDTYDRVDFEAIYLINIGNDFVRTLELNFRYFKEIDAEQSIKTAGLDDFRFITYRLGLKNNMYIAYSSGELPFNQQDNQIYEIGYTYKFD
ncbi:MAG: hypothetical protein ACI88H_001444 [Cocleimonas sp.]|jgi:hypothetical protein